MKLIMSRFTIALFLLGHFLITSAVVYGGGGGGTWSLLQPSIGITAMHMQLLPNDRVLIFDRTDFGMSNISLPAGKCRDDPNDKVLKTDCTAHSVEYDAVSNSVRPLMVLTDVWCSSGALFPDGSFVQTGGYSDGERNVRVFKPCSDCDWVEISSGLITKRWYSTNHILPDGKQIIVGGRRQFNYEFYPKSSPGSSAIYKLPFLSQTSDPKIENNLYPFVFLNVDGNLFIFANNRAILFDYQKSSVVKSYPQIPGGDPRSYPSTGSAVLLPLKNVNAPTVEAEVLVCGGAPKGAFQSAGNGKFVPALNSCGRIRITDPDPEWAMETMPFPRVMGDMLLLPNGHVLIINGGGSGAAGWENGRDPVFHPVIYRPDRDIGSTRFEVLNPADIPRMYHSSALLLRDGRILVGGSNPHTYYNFTGVLFPTELSLEGFSPPYLDPDSNYLRPKIVSPVSGSLRFTYGQKTSLQFSVESALDSGSVLVTMVSPSFNTHSFAMNARLLVLDTVVENSNSRGKVSGADSTTTSNVMITMPGSGNLAPSGFYLLFVVHQEIPSEGIWIHIE